MLSLDQINKGEELVKAVEGIECIPCKAGLEMGGGIKFADMDGPVVTSKETLALAWLWENASELLAAAKEVQERREITKAADLAANKYSDVMKRLSEK